MNKRRIALMILLLLGLIGLPMRSVLAFDRIESATPNQNANTVFSSPLNVSKSEHLNQEPQPTPPAPEVSADSIAAGRTLFLPVVSMTLPVTVKQQPGYFVSPSGSDSNPGTWDRPWRTIQKAAGTLVAGGMVKILPGTYYEKLAPKNSGKANAYITYTADPGTVILDGSGISLSGDSRGDGLVQIQGKSYIKVQNLTVRDSSVNCVNVSENSSGTHSTYIEITGLNIQYCNKVGIYVQKADHILLQNNTIDHVDYSSGIGVWRSTYATVDDNKITNVHRYHESQGAYNEALTISNVNHFEVKNNTLDNTGDLPSSFPTDAYSDKLGIDVKESSQNGSVFRNIVRHMNAQGIYVDGWLAGTDGTPTLNHINIYQNIVADGGGISVGCEKYLGIVEYVNIYNNLLTNTFFAAIQVRGAHGDGLRKNIAIYNNTIYGADIHGGNGGAGIYITTSHLGSNNGDAPVIIRNNISMFYFLPSGGTLGQIVAGTSTIAGMIAADHNLVSGPEKCSTSYPGCVEVGSRISASAQTVFSNPSAWNLHLKSGSPAINAGVGTGLVTQDFDGVPRPQPDGSNYDIGVYEFK